MTVVVRTKIMSYNRIFRVYCLLVKTLYDRRSYVILDAPDVRILRIFRKKLSLHKIHAIRLFCDSCSKSKILLFLPNTMRRLITVLVSGSVCRMKFFQKYLFHLICARHCGQRRTFSFRFAAAVIVCDENNFVNTARYGPGFECEPHAVIANEHARWRKPPTYVQGTVTPSHR